MWITSQNILYEHKKELLNIVLLNSLGIIVIVALLLECKEP